MRQWQALPHLLREGHPVSRIHLGNTAPQCRGPDGPDASNLLAVIPSPRKERAVHQPSRLSYLVKQLELAVRAEMDVHARDYGLTTLQYTALTVLERHPAMSGAELSRRSFVSPQAGNEIVAHLERKGLIERTPDAHNRRILRMRLTREGERVVGACEGWMDDLEKAMLAGLAQGDVRALRRILGTCVGNMEDQRMLGNS
jgi:DNA-binding MarR family transcriptional regulator